MERKFSDEGRTFKTLPDGRVLFRTAYGNYDTVVLTAAEHARIKALTWQETILSTLISLPALPVVILTVQGKIAVPTAAAALMVICLLGYLVHLRFRRRQQAILNSAPVSVEQLPGLSRGDCLAMLTSAIPPRARRHLLWYLVFGCACGWWIVFKRLLGVHTSNPGTPSLFIGVFLAVAGTAGLAVYWKTRRKKGSSISG